MHTTQFTISTKKGDSQTLRWLVVQSIPYPDVDGGGGRLRWRNCGGLIGGYGRNAEGIGESYYCYLLEPGEEPPADYSRRQYAGYDGNGGTMKFRGMDLGEMRIQIEDRNSWQSDNILVNVHDRPTDGERKAIEELVCPMLRAFIAANKEALKAESVAKIKANVADRIAKARAELLVMEQQAADFKY